MPVDEQMIFRILILVMAVLASIWDIKKKEIPILFIVLLGICSVTCGIFGFFSGKLALGELLFSLMPGAAFLFMSVVTRESIGFGDGLFLLSSAVPFGAVGACVGIIIAMFISSFFAIIILATGKGSRKSRIPFVPFITLGMGVCAYAGL